MDSEEYRIFMKLTAEQAEQLYIWATSPGAWFDLEKKRILRPREVISDTAVFNATIVGVSSEHKKMEALYEILFAEWVRLGV